MKCRSLILADRHFGVLEGTQGLLHDLFDSIVMAADEVSLMTAAASMGPDLVIMDLTLSGKQEARLAERFLERYPKLRLVVLSIHDEAAIAERLLAAGATAFVVKRALGTDLIPAVRVAIAGGTYVSPTVPVVGAPSRLP